MAIQDLLTGIFGGNAGKSQAKEANKLMRDQVAKLEAIGIPTIEAQKIALQTPELVDQLVAEQLGPSAMEGVAQDPRLKEAGLSALQQMAGLSETGLGAEDLAALEQIRRGAAGQAQAQKDTALQDMASRGMMDSGASLVAQLGAGQAAADRASQQGMQQASQAAAARRAAIADKANMASNMSQQDLARQSQIASARDTIAQFNAQNRQNVNAQNIGARQNIENQRAATANQQEIFNKGLQQQDFQNRMAKAGAASGAVGNLAANLSGQAAAAQQAQQQMTGNLINAGTTIGAASMNRPDAQTPKKPGAA